MHNHKDDARDPEVALSCHVLNFTPSLTVKACDQLLLVRAVAQLLLVSMLFAYDLLATDSLEPDLDFTPEHRYFLAVAMHTDARFLFVTDFLLTVRIDESHLDLGTVTLF